MREPNLRARSIFYRNNAQAAIVIQNVKTSESRMVLMPCEDVEVFRAYIGLELEYKPNNDNAGIDQDSSIAYPAASNIVESGITDSIELNKKLQAMYRPVTEDALSKDQQKAYRWFMKRLYPIVLIPDIRQSWIVVLPDLPGCLSHGSHMEECIEFGHKAKQKWLLEHIKANDTINSPHTINPRSLEIPVIEEDDRKPMIITEF